MDKIQIVRGIAMPFFPMRPATGRVIRNRTSVQELLKEVNQQKYDWIMQPKMSGDRACIAYLDGEVHVQNRHGTWYRHKVSNKDAFKKLPNKTVLDGEVFKGKFYPFECIAIDGKSMTDCTASEREVLAFQLCKFLGVDWKFERPARAWLLKLNTNQPEYDGIVLKRAHSPYILGGSANTVSLDWMKRTWA